MQDIHYSVTTVSNDLRLLLKFWLKNLASIKRDLLKDGTSTLGQQEITSDLSSLIFTANFLNPELNHNRPLILT